MKRTTKQLIYLVLSLLIAGIGGLWFYFQEAQLPREGTLEIPGLKAPVELLIDNDGFYHLTARYSADLYRALGYLHASQYLPRMDLFLRTANGTLSEVFGKEYLEIDIYTRTIGFAELADDFIGQVDSTVLRTLAAYSGGINSFIEKNARHLPRTFKLKNYAPSHWRPVDCLAVQRLLAWSLSDQLVKKIVFYKLLEIYGPEKVRDGFPTVKNLPSAIFPMYNTLLFSDLNQLLSSHLDLLNLLNINISDFGSGWVLAANQNTNAIAALGSDLPTFMNDYHCIVELHAPGIHAGGISIPGVPAILCGHNFTIGWNRVIRPADNLEFILTPVLNNRYLHGNQWLDFYTRSENICIRNGRDTTITVRKTNFGPLIGPLIQELTPQQAVSIHWKGFSFSDEHKGLHQLLAAANWDAFKEALQRQVLPTAEWDYLDIRGNIGTARLVSDLELSHNTTRIPAPSRYYEPDFRSPVRHLFRNFNPINGSIFHHQTSQYFNKDSSICNDPVYGDQPMSLETLLNANPNPKARGLLPFIKEIINPADLNRPLHRQALQVLTVWNCENYPPGPAVVIFETFLDKLYEKTYRDELDLSDPLLYEQFIRLKHEIFPNILYLLQTGESSWFDNIRTPATVERRKDVVVDAFAEAVDFLVKKYSPNIAQWRAGGIMPDDQIAKTRFLLTLAPEPHLSFYSIRLQRRNIITRENVISPIQRQLSSGDPLKLIRDGVRIVSLQPPPTR